MIDANVSDKQTSSSLMVPMIIIIHCCDEEDVPMDRTDFQSPSDSYNKHLLSPPVMRETYQENPWTFNHVSPFIVNASYQC